MKLCRRKTDGALFRPSYPENYSEADAIADSVNMRQRFYFRRVRWQWRKWWQLSGRWVDTGEVWEPLAGEFDVIETEDRA